MKLYRIKKSKIDNKGRGLYATRDVKAGTKIINYIGKILTNKQVDDSDKFDNKKPIYLFTLNKRYTLDVDFSNSNMSGSFILDIYPMNTNFENVHFDQDTKINTCLNSDLISKIVNRIFRTTNVNNSPSLEPLQNILLSICN